jgi:IS5 family transposase
VRLGLAVVLLSAVALAAPGATAHGAEKEKEKKEQKPDDRTDDKGDDRRGKITICHIPPGNRSARHTISVSESAWQAHQGHGDHRGVCGRGGTNQDRRFSAMDANDDGVISLREWRGDRAAFDRLDRNKNGSISRGEFSRY